MRRLSPQTTLVAAILATGVAAVTAGCSSGSDSTSPQQQLPGAYSLRTVNGRSAPFIIGQDSTGTLTLNSDVYTLNSDGTFTEQESGSFAPTVGASSPESYSDSGRWTLTGTTIVITYASDGTSETGAFSGGNTITFSAGTVTAVYQK